MQRNYLRVYRFILLLTALLVLSSPCAVWAKNYKLTMQSAFPRGDVSVPLLQVFCDETKAASNGEIDIKWHGAPEIVPPEFLAESVSNGAVDLMQSIGPYCGNMPLGDVEFGLPMAYNIPWKQTYTQKAQALRELFFDTGYIDIFREEYARRHNLYYIDMITAPMVILSVKPLENLDDFRGVKIRTDGLNLNLYNMVGMRSTNAVAGTETYISLKLGTIDAAEWDISAITGLNWHEAAPYWVQGIDSLVVMNVAISKDIYDEMSPLQQEALRKAGQAYWDAALDLYENEVDSVEKLVAEGKIHKVTPNDDVLALFNTSAEQLWHKGLLKQNNSYKNAVAILQNWIKENSQVKIASTGLLVKSAN